MKSLLPTYDVFDEDRYFEPGPGLETLDVAGRRAAVSVCEDVWNDRDFWQRPRYLSDPIDAVARPRRRQSFSTCRRRRSRPASRRCAKRCSACSPASHGVHVVYVNQVGGNDDLIFDGRSVVLAPDGGVVARAAAFAEAVVVVDLDAPAADVLTPDVAGEEEVFRALVLGTADYARKCGFRDVLLGLSGGIDSALTAVIAAAALGRDHVLGVLMPSPFSSQGSIDDSVALAARLGIRTLTLPIAGVMGAFEATLADAFAGRAADVTEENIQARARGNLLMALSNKFGSLLLTTGNKSELAVGYCTLYGDMSGGLAVIADLPKTRVYQRLRLGQPRTAR